MFWVNLVSCELGNTFHVAVPEATALMMCVQHWIAGGKPTLWWLEVHRDPSISGGASSPLGISLSEFVVTANSVSQFLCLWTTFFFAVVLRWIISSSSAVHIVTDFMLSLLSLLSLLIEYSLSCSLSLSIFILCFQLTEYSHPFSSLSILLFLSVTLCWALDSRFRMLQDGNTEDTECLLEVFAKPLETAGGAATEENSYNSLSQLICSQIEKRNYIQLQIFADADSFDK